MDALASGFAILLIGGIVIFGLGYAIRHRDRINKWLNPTYYAGDDRKLSLEREIEDCQRELAWIEDQEKKAETGD